MVSCANIIYSKFQHKNCMPPTWEADMFLKNYDCFRLGTNAYLVCTNSARIYVSLLQPKYSYVCFICYTMFNARSCSMQNILFALWFFFLFNLNRLGWAKEKRLRNAQICYISQWWLFIVHEFTWDIKALWTIRWEFSNSMDEITTFYQTAF